MDMAVIVVVEMDMAMGGDIDGNINNHRRLISFQ